MIRIEATKEKLEIVKVRGEPRLLGKPHNSGRRIFATAGGEKCSNYFRIEHNLFTL